MSLWSRIDAADTEELQETGILGTKGTPPGVLKADLGELKGLEPESTNSMLQNRYSLSYL